MAFLTVCQLPRPLPGKGLTTHTHSKMQVHHSPVQDTHLAKSILLAFYPLYSRFWSKLMHSPPAICGHRPNLSSFPFCPLDQTRLYLVACLASSSFTVTNKLIFTLPTCTLSAAIAVTHRRRGGSHRTGWRACGRARQILRGAPGRWATRYTPWCCQGSPAPIAVAAAVAQ